MAAQNPTAPVRPVHLSMSVDGQHTGHVVIHPGERVIVEYARLDGTRQRATLSDDNGTLVMEAWEPSDGA